MCSTCSGSTPVTYSCTKTPICNRVSLELAGLTRVYEWFNGVCELDILGNNTGNIRYNTIGELAKYEQHHLDNYDIANKFVVPELRKSIFLDGKYKREIDVPNIINVIQLANLLDISIESAKILLDNRFTQNLEQCPLRYLSAEITGTIQRNDCPPNYTGSVVTYTLPAGAFISQISQVDADTQAQAEYNRTRQGYANTYGVCTENTKYGNEEQCTTWSRDNCPFNHTTTPVVVCVPANTFYSYISLADANTMALTRLDQTKQSLANDIGICTPITFFSVEQSYTANCIPPATGSNTVTIPANQFTSTISQVDANNKAQLQAKLSAEAGLVCIAPALPNNICVTFNNLQNITPGAIGVYNLQVTLVNGKQIFTKLVQNELENGTIENWTMQWQWSSSLNVWQLFKFVNGNLNPTTAIAQTTTDEIIGSTTSNGTIRVENFTPGVLCSCQSSCYSGTLRTDNNSVVLNSIRGFTRDYSYLYKGVETHIQAGVQTTPTNTSSYHRWRKENSNLWRLMNYVSGTPVEVDRKNSSVLIDNVNTNKNFNQILNLTQISLGGFCNIECS